MPLAHAPGRFHNVHAFHVAALDEDEVVPQAVHLRKRNHPLHLIFRMDLLDYTLIAVYGPKRDAVFSRPLRRFACGGYSVGRGRAPSVGGRSKTPLTRMEYPDYTSFLVKMYIKRLYKPLFVPYHIVHIVQVGGASSRKRMAGRPG
jgi:hypothetical protein